MISLGFSSRTHLVDLGARAHPLGHCCWVAYDLPKCQKIQRQIWCPIKDVMHIYSFFFVGPNLLFLFYFLDFVLLVVLHVVWKIKEGLIKVNRKELKWYNKRKRHHLWPDQLMKRGRGKHTWVPQFLTAVLVEEVIHAPQGAGGEVVSPKVLEYPAVQGIVIVQRQLVKGF